MQLSLCYTYAKLTCFLCCSCSENAHVGDNVLQTLHTLIRLQELLSLDAPGVEVTIRFVPGDALRDVQKTYSGTVESDDESDDESDEEMDDVEGGGGEQAQPEEPAPLLEFPDRFGPSQLRVRFCKTWKDAIQTRLHIRALFITNLQWFCSVASHQQRVACWQGEAKRCRAILYPPLSWFDLLERKEAVYEEFQEFMLPARWVQLGVKGNLRDLEHRLLVGWPEADYWVKGSNICSGATGAKIYVKDGKCAELMPLLEEYVQQQHQVIIGIQQYAEDFSEFELRTWLVMDEPSQQWIRAITLETSTLLNAKGVVETSAILHAPLSDAGTATAVFIQRMLQEKGDFFRRLGALGARSVRVDCGWIAKKRRVFLSEFSPAGDSYIWTSAHELELAWRIGRDLGDGLWRELQLRQGMRSS
jgi:hypothetical protein